jgi:hypothetical protein
MTHVRIGFLALLLPLAAALASACTSSGGPGWTLGPNPTATGATTPPAAAATPGSASVTGMPGMSGMPGVPSASASPTSGGSDSPTTVPNPSAPPYELRDATAPAVLPGTVHDIELPIVDKDMTVATGDVVHTWIVGTIFDSVIREGVALERGNAGGYGSQAVDLAPAQGAIVEFQTAEDGMYVMVDHAFNFVGRGAVGVIQSGDGIPNR